MTKTFKYAVTAISTYGTRIIVSRHATLKAAEKALKLAHGHPDYQISPL